MELWNDGIAGTVCALFFVTFDSGISNLHSAIDAGGDLMLWIMDGPGRGKNEIYDLRF